MNKFITAPVTGIALCFILFIQTAKSQSAISGHVFNDLNNNQVYDPGEGLQYINVWLMDKAAVSPYYLVYPVQTAVSAADGVYSFTNVGNGNYQVRIKLSSTSNAMLNGSKHGVISNSISDNNPYTADNNPNGLTDLDISTTNNYNNIDFAFISSPAAPRFTPENRFAFDNGANSFVNVMTKTFALPAQNCRGVNTSPTITFTTDRQCMVSSQLYPQAGDNLNNNGMTWPGTGKGGFYPDDITLQMNFGQSCYNPANNDRATLTITFSNLVTDVRFSIYDIDCVNPQLVNGSIDHVKITGFNGSNTVMPQIILPQMITYNTVSGNTVSGWPDYPDNNIFNNYPDEFNSGNADHGDANIYFPSVIDRVVIEYEEYAPVLIPSVKKILLPVTPINAESQWGTPTDPGARGISIGSIGYTLYCKTLAASLLSFEAKAAGQQVNLQWKSSNEQQLQQYRIERLSESGSWMELGSIKPVAAGLYHFTDKHPLKGTNQYRLVMLNNDGSFTLSGIRVAVISSTANDISILNNPSSALNIMLYGDAVRLDVFDVSGQLISGKAVHNTNPAAGMKMSFAATEMNAGFYFVKAAFANGETKTVKFVKN